jgi:hypothetical protein
MSEPFENQLVNKIRDTFANYREPFDEDAWVLMKKKLEGSKKKTFILFINIVKAASVVLLVGLTGLYVFKSKTRDISGFEKHNLSITPVDSKVIIPEDSDNNFGLINNIEIHQEHPIYQFVESDTTKEIIDTKIRFAKTEDGFQKEFIEPELNFDSALFIKSDTAFVISEPDNSGKTLPILLPLEEDFVIHEKQDKKFNIGIALSSYYSTSDIGAKDHLSVGGGLQAEYAISDLISINSGVLIADHQFNTDASGIFKGAMYDAVENELAYAGEVKTEVRLVGIDIPLNISFKLDKFSITSGISSMVYLKESYSEDRYVKSETEYLYEKVNTTETNGAFQSFDFAKLLNVSVGYMIPMKKGRMVLEPFAKIPIGEMTGYDISYGYGGITLRYDF